MARKRPPQTTVAAPPRTAPEWACVILGGHRFTDSTTWLSPRTLARTGRVFCSCCGTPGIPRRLS